MIIWKSVYLHICYFGIYLSKLPNYGKTNYRSKSKKYLSLNLNFLSSHSKDIWNAVRSPTKLIFPTPKWAMYMKLTPTTCHVCDVTLLLWRHTYDVCSVFPLQYISMHFVVWISSVLVSCKLLALQSESSLLKQMKALKMKFIKINSLT